MNILGLSVFTDSSAAIVKDGEVVCAVEEERLSRIKHHEGLPDRSIAECLEISGLSLADLDAVAVGWNPWLGWRTRIWAGAKSLIQTSGSFQAKLSRGDNYLRGCRDLLGLRSKLASLDPIAAESRRIIYVDHHRAHAASAFYASPFDVSDIIVADGIGESATISLFYGDNTNLKRRRTIRYPHSLGHVYAAVTGFLGFKMTHDEGKVMALAAYGRDTYRTLFKKLVRMDRNRKSISIDTKLLDYHAARRNAFSHAWLSQTGLNPRKHGEPLEQRHKDLACSLQICIEETVLGFLRTVLNCNPGRPLCAAGGLFLNSVLNGKIIREYSHDFFVQPAAGDNGVSLGSALKVSADIEKHFFRKPFSNVYLGRAYADTAIRGSLNKFGIIAHQSQNIFQETAGLIAQGKVIGWFRGRMEYGPRALGNRSILAAPTYDWMKDDLNSKVKHRESFRPFACSVLWEDVGRYFEDAQECPYMLKTFIFRKEYRYTFPAVTHVDYSCRIQTVRHSQNPDFYRLLEILKNISGHGLVLNTSLNIATQPIVNTPEEALLLLRHTALDVLVLEDYVIPKESVCT